MKRYKNITKILQIFTICFVMVFACSMFAVSNPFVANQQAYAAGTQITVSEETPMQNETYAYKNEEYMPQHMFIAEGVEITAKYTFYQENAGGQLNPIGEVIKTMPSNTVEFTGVRPKNVGKYKVVVEASAEGFEPFSSSYTITIEKPENAITVNLSEAAQNLTYTGEVVDVTSLFTYDLPENATNEDVSYTIYYQNMPVSNIKNAGEYRVEFTSHNFNFTSQEVGTAETATFTFQVKQAEVNIKVIGPEELVYESLTYKPESIFEILGVKNENLLYQTTITVSFSNMLGVQTQYVATYNVANQAWTWRLGSASGTIVSAPVLQAGTHTFTVEIKNNANYAYKSAEHTVTVAPKHVTLTASTENYFEGAFQFIYTNQAYNLLQCIQNLSDIYAYDHERIVFEITGESGIVENVQNVGTYHVVVALNNNYTTDTPLEFDVKVSQLVVDTKIFDGFENSIFSANSTYNRLSHFTPKDAYVTDMYGRKYPVHLKFEIQQLQKQADGTYSYVVINTATYRADIGGYVYASQTMPVNAGTYKVVATYDKVNNAHLQAPTEVADTPAEFILEIQPYAVRVFFENYQNFVEHSGQQVTAHYFDLSGNKIACKIQYTPNMLVLTAGKYTATAIIEDPNYKAQGEPSIQFLVLPATNFLPMGTIIAIVVACVVAVAVVVVVIVWAVRRKNKAKNGIEVNTKAQDVAIIAPENKPETVEVHPEIKTEETTITPVFTPSEEVQEKTSAEVAPSIETQEIKTETPEVHELSELNEEEKPVEKPKRGRPKKVTTIATEVEAKPKTTRAKSSTKTSTKKSSTKTSSKKSSSKSTTKTKRTKKETTDEILKDIRSLLQEQNKKDNK